MYVCINYNIYIYIYYTSVDPKYFLKDSMTGCPRQRVQCPREVATYALINGKKCRGAAYVVHCHGKG